MSEKNQNTDNIENKPIGFRTALYFQLPKIIKLNLKALRLI